MAATQTAPATSPKPEPEPTPTAPPSGDRKKAGDYRVLVTGFHDWKELGDPPNVWRCRDNPSCRLLLGEPSSDEPTTVDGGALVTKLKSKSALADGRAIDWSFATLPVTWEAATSLEIRDYDLVVHLGLGVYDSFDRILIERGAFNRRRGKDATGQMRDESIDPDGGERRAAPSDIADVLRAVDGRQFGAYALEVADARDSNDYLCNETHYRALQELEAARRESATLERVHFVHIPYAKGDDYDRLAEGVGEVVLALLPGA